MIVPAGQAVNRRAVIPARGMGAAGDGTTVARRALVRPVPRASDRARARANEHAAFLRTATTPLNRGRHVRRRGLRGLGDDVPFVVDAQDWSPPQWVIDLQNSGSSGGLFSSDAFAGGVLGGNAGAFGSGGGAGSSWLSILEKSIPAGFTTLQEAIAQPGQLVRSGNTLVTGANPAGAPFSLLGGSSFGGISTGTILLIAGLGLGALALFSSKK